MGAYAVLYLGWSTNYTMYKIDQHIEGQFAYFCDHHGSQRYGLCILDCLTALNAGVNRLGWFKNDVAKPRGLDMHWIIPNKVIAMRDPREKISEHSGEIDKKYIQELRRQSINVIVRFNKLDFEENAKKGIPYDQSDVELEGFYHDDIPFKDCGIPTDTQVSQFLELISDPEVKAAVHCHAGLGRTGTMIACYLMSNHGFTSRQAVAWLNMSRRGSVMGKQHQFLDSFFERICEPKPLAETNQATKYQQQSIRDVHSHGNYFQGQNNQQANNQQQQTNNQQQQANNRKHEPGNKHIRQEQEESTSRLLTPQRQRYTPPSSNQLKLRVASHSEIKELRCLLSETLPEQKEMDNNTEHNNPNTQQNTKLQLRPLSSIFADHDTNNDKSIHVTNDIELSVIDIIGKLQKCISNIFKKYNEGTGSHSSYKTHAISL